MAFQATVIPVMIATPGDVTEERDVIRAVLHDWNDVNASDSKLMLAAVGWDTHSSPELGARPQALINERILKNCDLLIGVFWTRLGTPTGKAASGSVEEIEEHVAAGKPAMIYFSTKPVAPDSIDVEQYSQVKAIQEKWLKKGIIEKYSSIEEFRSKLNKQLPICLAQNPFLQSLKESKKLLVTRTQLSESPQSMSLSSEAMTLLKAASEKDDGYILTDANLGGRFVLAGGKYFGEGHGRDSAKWEAALEELVSNGLVVRRGYKGDAYQLTHQGWAVADSIN